MEFVQNKYCARAYIMTRLIMLITPRMIGGRSPDLLKVLTSFTASLLPLSSGMRAIIIESKRSRRLHQDPDFVWPVEIPVHGCDPWLQPRMMDSGLSWHDTLAHLWLRAGPTLALLSTNNGQDPEWRFRVGGRIGMPVVCELISVHSSARTWLWRF